MKHTTLTTLTIIGVLFTCFCHRIALPYNVGYPEGARTLPAWSIEPSVNFRFGGESGQQHVFAEETGYGLGCNLRTGFPLGIDASVKGFRLMATSYQYDSTTTNGILFPFWSLGFDVKKSIFQNEKWAVSIPAGVGYVFKEDSSSTSLRAGILASRMFQKIEIYLGGDYIHAWGKESPDHTVNMDYWGGVQGVNILLSDRLKIGLDQTHYLVKGVENIIAGDYYLFAFGAHLFYRFE